jgi:O-methyltransferase
MGPTVSTIEAPPAHSRYLGDRALLVYESLERALRHDGDIAECGVAAGETAAGMLAVLRRTRTRRQKRLHLFDTFAGLPSIMVDSDRIGASGQEQFAGNFSHSLPEVRRRVEDDPAVVFHSGLFSDTLRGFSRRLCFIHADADLYLSTTDIIQAAVRVLVPGGVIVFDDYENVDFPGVRRAVEAHLPSHQFSLYATGMQCVATRLA